MICSVVCSPSKYLGSKKLLVSFWIIKYSSILVISFRTHYYPLLMPIYSFHSVSFYAIQKKKNTRAWNPATNTRAWGLVLVCLPSNITHLQDAWCFCFLFKKSFSKCITCLSGFFVKRILYERCWHHAFLKRAMNYVYKIFQNMDISPICFSLVDRSAKLHIILSFKKNSTVQI